MGWSKVPLKYKRLEKSCKRVLRKGQITMNPMGYPTFSQKQEFLSKPGIVSWILSSAIVQKISKITKVVLNLWRLWQTDKMIDIQTERQVSLH